LGIEQRDAVRSGVRPMGKARYEVRVRGKPDVVLLTPLSEGLEATTDPVRTVLRGRLPDQAALAGLLTRIWLLGLELVEVRRLPQGGRLVTSRSHLGHDGEATG
jgi:hypothetical protein